MPTVPIESLPVQIDVKEAVCQCYSTYIDSILDALCSNQSTLVECDKLLVNYILIALRDRNKSRGSRLRMEIIDHRQGDSGATSNTAAALTNAVRNFAKKVAESDCQSCVFVVPNFDLLVSADQTSSHLDTATRDILAVLYENPDLVIVAFKDINLNIPRTVSSFFPKLVEIFGVDRIFMDRLITQQEARRIDVRSFDPYQMYKYVSGLNVVKLRKVLQGFTANSYVDGSGTRMLNEIRKATIQDAEAELPNVDMSMIGGYDKVKNLLNDELLGLLRFIQERAAVSDINEIKSYERLIPRHILFTGPPGTGKTFFCKALATRLNATIFIINGPELKNKWVGESERAIRNIFNRARKCAPSLIVFDEIDSFAKQRSHGDEGSSLDRFNGSTTHDNSMLNQLLTEMDGFKPEEMVFVIATTNIASSLDTALLSRFRYQLEIPYPEAADRRAIMCIYDEKYSLGLSSEVMDTIIEGTELWIDQNKWTRFAGRDLEALASALARYRLVESFRTGRSIMDIPITPELAKNEILSRIKTKPSEITFDDIGGYSEVKERLKEEILDVLKASRNMTPGDRAKAEKLIPKGVIFEGPPGTGKTMFAKALAKELGATVSVVNGPELKGGLVGQTEERIRRIFEEARKNAPSVVVFDEIDSIAAERSEYFGGSFERSMVNQLLTELDGINEKELLFVVATTNYAKTLDKALKRPGRFEYIIGIPYPDADARREIFRIYDEKYSLGLDEAALEHLIFRTENWVDPEAGIRFSGDHIEAICRGIARKKMMEPAWRITNENLDAVVAQRTKKPLDVSPEEEMVIAAHEAGHAIISLHIKGCRTIRRISIASEYDGSLGYVLHEDMPNKFIQNREELLAEICCLMGGRMAEKKLFGEIATGSANDIEKATLIATHIVASFGMDEEIGARLILHPMIHGQKAANSVSPELMSKVEQGVARIIREQEKRALECIEECWDQYDMLRERLLKEKVVEFRNDASNH